MHEDLSDSQTLEILESIWIWKMAGTLTGLQDHLKLAREYAIEGVYDTSIIFFDGVIAQINRSLSLSLSLSLLSSLCIRERTYLMHIV